MELHHILISWDLIVTGNESLMIMDPSSLYVYEAQQFSHGLCSHCTLYGVIIYFTIYMYYCDVDISINGGKSLSLLLVKYLMLCTSQFPVNIYWTNTQY